MNFSCILCSVTKKVKYNIYSIVNVFCVCVCVHQVQVHVYCLCNENVWCEVEKGWLAMKRNIKAGKIIWTTQINWCWDSFIQSYLTYVYSLFRRVCLLVYYYRLFTLLLVIIERSAFVCVLWWWLRCEATFSGDGNNEII